jgi:transcriptional regulator with XRE-family HTH domain
MSSRCRCLDKSLPRYHSSRREFSWAAANATPSSIAHFETGTRKPSFDTLRRLANALVVTTDYLLGRVDSPGLAEAGDPLYRDVGKRTGRDREIAEDFLGMLAKRSRAKRKEHDK